MSENIDLILDRERTLKKMGPKAEKLRKGSKKVISYNKFNIQV
jgi:hypothetical protein